MRWNLNETEIRIMEIIADRGASVVLTRISVEIGVSLPWTSNCISHLEELGLVDLERRGNHKGIRISRSPPGNTFRRLYLENRQMNLFSILSNSGLEILPYFLESPDSMAEVSRRSGLSYRTVFNYVTKLQTMGAIIKKDSNDMIINPLMKDLRDFIKAVTRARNERRIMEVSEGSVLIWSGVDEVLFSDKQPVNDEKILLAGPSLLEELGFDLTAQRTYMLWSDTRNEISLEECFAETLLIDPVNPRPRRLISDHIASGKLDMALFRSYMDKYGVAEDI